MSQTIYLTRSGKVNTTCPECSKGQMINVADLIENKEKLTIEVTCKCGHTYSAVVERRQYKRKEVHFSGKLNPGNQALPTRIVDISRGGLKLKTNDVLDLKVNDRIAVDFVLDDPHRSRVSKEGIVKTKGEDYVSVEFVSLEHFDKLGAYLLFHFD